MTATARYQIVHFDATARCGGKRSYWKTAYAVPCQFRNGQMVYDPAGIIRVGAMPNGLSGAAQWRGGGMSTCYCNQCKKCPNNSKRQALCLWCWRGLCYKNTDPT